MKVTSETRRDDPRQDFFLRWDSVSYSRLLQNEKITILYNKHTRSKMCVLEKFHTKKFVHCVSLPKWVGLVKETSRKNLIFPNNGADGYARQFNRKKRVFLRNARETDCTSSRETIVSEILSRGKVKGNRGLVVRGATLHVDARQDCRIIFRQSVKSAFRAR